MAAQDRSSLKNFFKSGMRPTADHFADLIDSALIMQDEGFRKTPKDGLTISTLGTERTLLSFCSGKSAPLYALSFIEDPHATAGPVAASPRLNLNGGLTIAPSQGGARRVSLDVQGRICIDGRMGRPWAPKKDAPLADGKWHAITPELHGCQAFEIMAGVGVHETRRYAMVHAVAMNTFNPAWFDDLLFRKKRIRRHDAFYHRLGDRLDLRWAPSDKKTRDASQKYGRDAKYQLEIRTRTPYPGNPPIKVFVTSLWFDTMAPTIEPTAAGPP